MMPFVARGEILPRSMDVRHTSQIGGFRVAGHVAIPTPAIRAAGVVADGS